MSLKRNVIVVGLCILGVVCAKAAPGDEVWKFETGGEIFGSPAMDREGNVYLGSRDKFLYSLNEAGELRWEFQTGDWVDSTPTLSLDEETVYVGSWDNYLYAVSAETGSLEWKFEAKNLIIASPSVDGKGNLFFGASDGFFYSLTSEGELRWLYFVGEEMDSSPAIDEAGNVYVGAFDGILYSFSNTGELRWTHATGVGLSDKDKRIKAPPTVGGDVVYVGGGDGRVHALTLEGVLLWEFEAPEKIDTGVVLREDGSLVVGCRDGFVYAFDENGVYLWASYVGDVFYSTPAVDSLGRVYVGSYLGNGVSGVSALSKEGDLLWETLSLGYIDASPLLSGDGKLYFGSYDGAFSAVESDGEAARTVWNRFGTGRTNRSQYASTLLLGDFGLWLEERGLGEYSSNPYADIDGDGFSVFEEYCFGGDPERVDSRLIEIVGSGGIDSLSFVAVSDSVGSVWYELQRSVDLKNWSSVSPVSRVALETSVGGSARYDRLRFDLGSGSDAKVFFRIKVY